MATEKLDDLKTKIEAHMNSNKGKLSHQADGVKDLPKIQQPTVMRNITVHPKKVYCAAWDKDSLHICTAGQEGTVLITNASTQVIKCAPIKCKFVMQCTMYGDLVACGGMQNIIEIHKIEGATVTKKKDMEGHEGYISQMHFIKGGSQLLSGSGDGIVKLWDLEKYKVIQEFKAHKQDVSGLCMNGPDSQVFGTSSTDKDVRMWDLRMKMATRKYTCKYSANCCAMMPDARGIVAGCDSASWEFFDNGCNMQVARGKVKSGRCESVAISSSGRVVYMGWDNGKMTVADTFIPDNQKELNDKMDKAHHQCGEGLAVCSLSVAPDGSALLSGSFDTTAKVWGAAIPK